MSDNSSLREWKDLLSAEASAGISFANLFIAIGTALLGLLVSKMPLSAAPLLIILGSTLVISGFYTSICYANTCGRIRNKNNSKSHMLKPIVWGNALSEYLGVYFLNFTIPTTIWAYTNNAVFTRVSYCIVVFGFIIYHLSNFDMLERIIKKKLARASVAIVFSFLIVACFELFILNKETLAYLAFGIFATLSILFVVWHVRTSETEW